MGSGAYLPGLAPSEADVMPDQSPKSDVDRTRGSIKEAIGKIIGDRKAIRRGAAAKIAVAPDTPRSP